MITIYTSHNSNSSRKAKAWLRKYQLPFIEQNVSSPRRCPIRPSRKSWPGPRTALPTSSLPVPRPTVSSSLS